jgi:hypothetical protein
VLKYHKHTHGVVMGGANRRAEAERLIKGVRLIHWSNTGNTGQTLVKHWSNTGQTLVKHWSNTGQTLVKHWSNEGAPVVASK